MPSFLGTFPFCVEEKNPIQATQEFVGTSSFLGSLYPIGMSLRHAMLLHWRLQSIDFYWSTTYIDPLGQFYIFFTENQTHSNEYESQYVDFFKSKVCSSNNSLFSTIGLTTNSGTFTSEYISTIDLFGAVDGISIWSSSLFGTPTPCVKFEGLYYPHINMNFFGYSRQYGTIRIQNEFWIDTGSTSINFIIEDQAYALTFYGQRQFGAEGSFSFSASSATCNLFEV